jgi:hypothetical protein
MRLMSKASETPTRTVDALPVGGEHGGDRPFLVVWYEPPPVG